MNEIDNRIPMVNDKNANRMFIFGEGEDLQVNFLEVIGKGGTCIAYKGEKKQNGILRQCIIKEYYPQYVLDKAEYMRDENTGMLHIVCSSEGEKEDIREKELAIQERNVNHEFETNNKLFYSKVSGNSPYVYAMDLKKKIGDSTYFVLDTSEGKTLYSEVNEKMGAGLEWRKAIQYTKRLLEIVRWMNRDMGYLHGDITPRNIWITGNAENLIFKILDFGSSFKKNEYDIEKMNQNEILDVAHELLYCEGIGSSTEGFRSNDMAKMSNRKQSFANESSNIFSATRFLQSVNAIQHERTDIHAVIKVFYYMVTGEVYDGIQCDIKLKRLEETKASPFLTDKLIETMKMNSKMHFDTVEKANACMDSFLDIIEGNCSPETLLASIGDELLGETEYDERLLAQLRIL